MRNFTSMLFLFQVTNVLLFAFCTKFNDADAATSTAGEMGAHPMFQDVHVMVFVGFGLLMTFLEKYSHSAVAFNFLISALAVQWGVLVHGFWACAESGDWDRIQLDISSLLTGDFAAVAVMISFGALMGKVSPMQMTVIMFFEMIFHGLNQMIGTTKLHAVDMGGSMFVHTFGAYFGLACSWMLTRPPKDAAAKSRTRSSNIWAMAGTLFLWCFWPSFNAVMAAGHVQHRVVVNTILALTASCITAFFCDDFFNHKRSGGRFGMAAIQNATLAGGVALGSCASMVVAPWSAMLTGSAAGLLCVLAEAKVQPWLAENLHLDDTRGVHNLHGLPGIIGAVAGIIAASTADDTEYGAAISTIFPARASNADGGEGWSASDQAKHQLYALLVTLGLAISGGSLTGFIVKFGGHFDEASWYNDTIHLDNGDADAELGDARAATPPPADNGARVVQIAAL